MEKKLPQKTTKQTKKSKIISAMLFLPLSILWRERKHNKFCKFDPEGTCGPIWPEVVPLLLPCHWLCDCIKKFVDMWSLKNDFLFYFIYWARIKKNIDWQMLWKEMEIKAMSEGINVLHNIWQSIVKKLYSSCLICSFVFFDSGLPPRLSGSAWRDFLL